MNDTSKEKIRILLVEDEERDIQAIREYMETVEDMELAGITNDSDQAILLTKELQPHIVLLDLELSYGYGSGLLYLKTLEEFNAERRPKIIVTTKVNNDYTLQTARDLGANFVLYKRQKGYRPEDIISTARLLFDHSILRPSMIPKSSNFSQSKADKQKRIMRRIYTEFLHIGLSSRLKGTDFLADAIYIVSTKKDDDQRSFRKLVYPDLEKKYKRNSANLHRNMINAIEITWRTVDQEILARYYKYPVSRNAGVPTASEFIYYYAQKIIDEVP